MTTGSMRGRFSAALRSTQLSDGAVRMLASSMTLLTFAGAVVLATAEYNDPTVQLLMLAVIASIIPSIVGLRIALATMLPVLAAAAFLGDVLPLSDSGLFGATLLPCALIVVGYLARAMWPRMAPVLIVLSALFAAAMWPLGVLYTLEPSSLGEALVMFSIVGAPFLGPPLLGWLEVNRLLGGSPWLSDVRVALMRVGGTSAALLCALGAAELIFSLLSEQLQRSPLLSFAGVAGWCAATAAGAGTLWFAWRLPRRLAAGQQRGRYHPGACAEVQWFLIGVWALIAAVAADKGALPLTLVLMLAGAVYVAVRILIAGSPVPTQSPQWIVLLQQPTRAARRLAQRLAAQWTYGPTTLLALPEAAAIAANAHTRVCMATDDLKRLFPLRSAHLADWDEGLPPSHAWHTLPMRELYAPRELWPDILTHRVAPGNLVTVVDPAAAEAWALGKSQAARLDAHAGAEQLQRLGAEATPNRLSIVAHLTRLLRPARTGHVIILHASDDHELAGSLRNALATSKLRWGRAVNPWMMTLDRRFGGMPLQFAKHALALQFRRLMLGSAPARALGLLLGFITGVRPDDQYRLILIEPEAQLPPRSRTLLRFFEMLIARGSFTDARTLSKLSTTRKSLLASADPGSNIIWRASTPIEELAQQLLSSTGSSSAPQSIQLPEDSEATTAVAEQRELYAAAVGESKAAYYVPRFMRFNWAKVVEHRRGLAASWNWAAFFGTIPWLLYRGMYGLVVAYLVGLMLSTVLALAAIFAIFGEGPAVLVYGIYGVLVYVLAPMYANAFYHRHVNKRIAALRRDGVSHAAVVESLRKRSSRPWRRVAAVASVLLGVGGLLAAIVIPAYNDYTVRSQVTEGLNVAASAKVAVAEYYAQYSTWPADLAAAAGSNELFSGKYVDSVVVENGTVLIRYGGEADPAIAGRQLALHPSAAENGDVSWRCGYASPPNRTKQAAREVLTSVAARFLPASCRSGPP